MVRPVSKGLEVEFENASDCPEAEAFETEELCAERTRLLSPLAIYFSQNHIRPEFQDGRSLDDAVESIGSRRCLASARTEDLGVPSKADWWLLQPEFPQIDVIQWRIKLREEDGSQILDGDGNELYGEREWYTLDNRRLYCLQKAAVRFHPHEVRVVVNVIRQEEGSCREFRKFRSIDRGRSIRLGHRDLPDLPRWCWRLEVGLAEEVLPAGSALPRQGKHRRTDRQGWMRRNGRKSADREEVDERTWSSLFANASLFVLVYASIRLLFAVWHHYVSHDRR
mmetsp:Transcript_2974/g.5158  ORF Transcript_2974/g.5158 Transcript_2974/m.5158 type:complete len:281 (+) Transcript_2974:93-935(+)